MTPVGDWGCGLFDLKRKKHLRWFHWKKFEKIRVVFPSFFFLRWAIDATDAQQKLKGFYGFWWEGICISETDMLDCQMSIKKMSDTSCFFSGLASQCETKIALN